MRRLRGMGMVLALALAAILPLEQAHCAWMSLQARPAAAAAGDHACCAGGSADATTPAPECLCIPLPVVALPSVVTVPPAALAAVFLAVHAEALLAPAPRAEGVLPPAEIGSPPLPVHSSAHGLRAPPAV